MRAAATARPTSRRALRDSASATRALRDSAEPMRRASTPTSRALRDSAERALRASADMCLAVCNAWFGLVMGHAAPTSTAEAFDVAKPRFSSCTISSRTAAAARPRRTTSRCAATLTMRSPPSRTSVGASCKPSGGRTPHQADEATPAPAGPTKPQGEGKAIAPLQRGGGGRSFVQTTRRADAAPGRRGHAGASGTDKAPG